MKDFAIYTDRQGKMPVLRERGDQVSIPGSHPCYTLYRNNLPVSVVPHDGQQVVYNYAKQEFEELLDVVADDSDDGSKVLFVGTRERCLEWLRKHADVHMGLRSRMTGRLVSWQI